MDIVLDSNIFRGDWLLRSKDIEVLLDYLKKTSSGIVLPQIILDEIEGLYIREAKKRRANLENATKNFNLLFVESNIEIGIPNTDFIEEFSKYKKFIMERLKIEPEMILPYNKDYLPLIANRVINRIKPANENGDGFRDTLIWLTIKDYAIKTSKKQVIFISENIADFANDNKDGLHDTLMDEYKIRPLRPLHSGAN